MIKLHNLSFLILIIMLSGCVKEQKNRIDLARERYSNCSCEELFTEYKTVREESNFRERLMLIREAASDKGCDAPIEKFVKEKMKQEEEEAKKWWDEQGKAALRQEIREKEAKEKRIKEDRARRARLLREIENEK